MGNVPALCRNCNTLFPSFIETGPNVKIRVYDLAQVCPRCGATAEIVSGAYETVDGVLKLIQANTITGQTLEKVRNILEHSKRYNKSPDDVLNKIKEEAPEIHPILKKILKNRSDLYFAISLILFFIQFCESPQEPISTEIIINQTINQHNKIIIENQEILILKEKRKRLYKDLKINPRDTLKKIPTYKPCPFCDSGKDYKFCCKKKMEKKYKH